jgi:hypothetical protein
VPRAAGLLGKGCRREDAFHLLTGQVRPLKFEFGDLKSLHEVNCSNL